MADRNNNTAQKKIADFLDMKASGAIDEQSAFYTYEPYDVAKRPDWVIDQAKKDGVDLYTDEMMFHIGADPHRFQTGFLLSTAPFRTLIAGSRNGKTITDLVDIGIMVSGEKPISLRYEKGVKTGFKRKVNKENVIRFGRFDISTGVLIDHDFNAARPSSWDEWDCGYIEGAGIYPDEKICKPGDTIWIGCTQRALTEQWWRRFEDDEEGVFPREFVDRKRGYNGYMKSENVVFGVRNIRLAMISYESGFRKFEAAGKEALGIHAVFFDEEPPDQACVTAAVTRCKYFALSETPYSGITYTKTLIFNPKKDRKKNVVFHATIYDSPYFDKETIDHRRSLMPPHEIGARIWGLHTELKGKPYFDRAKISGWIRNFKVPYTLHRFRPFEEYDGMISREGHDKPGLMSVEVLRGEALAENEQDVWRVYEDRREGMAYFLMADSAEGSDVPIESGDVLASLIMRPPIGDEKFPQIVASLRSTLKTVNFAWVCAYPLLYYNNALLCAEGPTRGSFNALFYAELSDYPFWYSQPSERWSTRKFRTVKGFDTNSMTRTEIFKDIITEVLNEFGPDDKPEICDEPLLKELAACILSSKAGKLRPDHPTDGTLDTTICYGQGLYVFKKSPEQIKCRETRKKEQRHRFGELLSQRATPQKAPTYLGEGQEDLR